MAKMGRPKKQIDQKNFENLCALQCTLEEINEFFGITHKTLERWCKETYGETFSHVFAKKRIVGKISLRRAGFELAKKNAAVWIFHAKNNLDMRDTPLADDESAVGPIPIRYEFEDARTDGTEN